MLRNAKKLVILGDAGVGKSCLIASFNNQKFVQKYLSSFAIDFITKSVTIDDNEIQLMIWDTPGQEISRPTTLITLNGVQGIILAFDLTNSSSFEHIKEIWLTEVNKYISNPIILIVGCKNDMTQQRKISTEEAKKYAESVGANYIETSAKDGINVPQVFNTLGKKIHEREVAENMAAKIDYSSAIHKLEKECQSYKDYLIKQLNSMIKIEKKDLDKKHSATANFTPNDLLDLTEGQKIIENLDKYFSTIKPSKNQIKLLGTAKKLLAVGQLAKTLEEGTDKNKFEKFNQTFSKPNFLTPFNVYSDSRTIKFLRFLKGILNPFYAYRRGKDIGSHFWQSGTKNFVGRMKKIQNPESYTTPSPAKK